jgi:hypothetical protein
MIFPPGKTRRAIRIVLVAAARRLRERFAATGKIGK